MITLVLKLGAHMIGSVPVDKNRFTDKEYLAGKVCELRDEFAAQLSSSFNSPVIYLEGVPSKMNVAIKDSVH